MLRFFSRSLVNARLLLLAVLASERRLRALLSGALAVVALTQAPKVAAVVGLATIGEADDVVHAATPLRAALDGADWLLLQHPLF